MYRLRRCLYTNLLNKNKNDVFLKCFVILKPTLTFHNHSLFMCSQTGVSLNRIRCLKLGWIWYLAHRFIAEFVLWLCIKIPVRILKESRCLQVSFGVHDSIGGWSQRYTSRFANSWGALWQYPLLFPCWRLRYHTFPISQHCFCFLQSSLGTSNNG